MDDLNWTRPNMALRPRPLIIVVCGPSGVGKTTIGRKLADRLCMAFEEGDDYHTESNIRKMSRGIALNDEDRIPWLERLRDEVIVRCQSQKPSIILACSALKKKYRDTLRGEEKNSNLNSSTFSSDICADLSDSPKRSNIFFVMLVSSLDTIMRDLITRKNHFMPPSLLCSQLAILEPLQLQNEGGGSDQSVESGMMLDRSKFPNIDSVVDAIQERLYKEYDSYAKVRM